MVLNQALKCAGNAMDRHFLELYEHSGRVSQVHGGSFPTPLPQTPPVQGRRNNSRNDAATKNSTTSTSSSNSGARIYCSYAVSK
jgi:hypothetical protein